MTCVPGLRLGKPDYSIEELEESCDARARHNTRQTSGRFVAQKPVAATPTSALTAERMAKLWSEVTPCAEWWMNFERYSARVGVGNLAFRVFVYLKGRQGGRDGKFKADSFAAIAIIAEDLGYATSKGGCSPIERAIKELESLGLLAKVPPARIGMACHYDIRPAIAVFTPPAKDIKIEDEPDLSDVNPLPTPRPSDHTETLKEWLSEDPEKDHE